LTGGGFLRGALLSGAATPYFGVWVLLLPSLILLSGSSDELAPGDDPASSASLAPPVKRTMLQFHMTAIAIWCVARPRAAKAATFGNLNEPWEGRSTQRASSHTDPARRTENRPEIMLE